MAQKICATMWHKSVAQLFYIILCIQFYRIGWATCAQNHTYSSMLSVQIYFHCMHNITETNYLKWQLSGGGTSGHRQYIAYYWSNKQKIFPQLSNYFLLLRVGESKKDPETACKSVSRNSLQSVFRNSLQKCIEKQPAKVYPEMTFKNIPLID